MSHPPEDSAATVLRHLEEQRGRLVSENDFWEQRRTILDELAQGARLRPFTVFTFLVIEAGLAALVAVGVAAGRGPGAGDYTLAWVSSVALLCGVAVFLQMLSAVRRDRERSLQERLGELEELRALGLITPEEYQELHAHILNARQRSAKVHP